MVLTALRPAPPGSTDWTRVRVLVAATIVLIYASFFFSVRGPQAHSFYLAFPVAALFAFSCWQMAAQAHAANPRRWERVAGAVIVSGIVVHTGLAIDRWPRQSLYADRELVAAAIAQRNDRFLGDRRDTAIELQDHRPRATDPVPDAGAYLEARPEEELQLVDAAWTPVVGSISRFRVTIAHRGQSAAWLDIRYQTAYTDAAGRQVAANDGVIKRILQPGETLAGWEIADGSVPAGATAATITIVGAERCIPAGR
jgi:hypothetical protein